MQKKVDNGLESQKRLPSTVYDHRGALYGQSEELAVGDKVTVYARDELYDKEEKGRASTIRPVKAEVVYIHPKRRFYTVRMPAGYLVSFPWGVAS